MNYNMVPSRYNQTFKVFPMHLKKQGLDSSGKILLPPSALNALSRLNIQYPMLFQISNPNKELNRQSHCGVLEFIAEEGVCYLPKWMIDNLLLSPGDYIDIKNASLPKGTFVKIQPHTSNFLEISNPKAVLENTLRKFATLTKGDEIMIDYNKTQYYLKVVELKPVNPSNAISIIEADVEVDFAPPMDYKEEVKKPTQTNSGTGLTFGSTSSASIGIPGAGKRKDSDDSDDSDSDDDEPKFKAFSGSGMKLSGKLDTPKGSYGTSPKPPSLINNTPPKTGGGNMLGANLLGGNVLGTSPKPSTSSGGNLLGTSPKPSTSSGGNLLGTSPKPITPPTTTSPPNEKKDFVPFQGKGYSLK